MLVRWNGKNVWSIGSGMADASVIQFIPGPNDIKKEQWDCIKNHPEIKLRQTQEIICEKRGKIMRLEILEAPKDAPKGDDGDDNKEVSITSLGVKKAKALVLETFNVELLRKWDEIVTHKGVKDAIAKQFEAIEQARIDDANVE